MSSLKRKESYYWGGHFDIAGFSLRGNWGEKRTYSVTGER